MPTSLSAESSGSFIYFLKFWYAYTFPKHGTAAREILIVEHCRVSPSASATTSVFSPARPSVARRSFPGWRATGCGQYGDSRQAPAQGVRSCTLAAPFRSIRSMAAESWIISATDWSSPRRSRGAEARFAPRLVGHAVALAFFSSEPLKINYQKLYLPSAPNARGSPRLINWLPKKSRPRVVV